MSRNAAPTPNRALFQCNAARISWKRPNVSQHKSELVNHKPTPTPSTPPRRKKFSPAACQHSPWQKHYPLQKDVPRVAFTPDNRSRFHDPPLKHEPSLHVPPDPPKPPPARSSSAEKKPPPPPVSRTLAPRFRREPSCRAWHRHRESELGDRRSDPHPLTTAPTPPPP